MIGKVSFVYKSVDEQGNIYLSDPDDHLVQFEFWRFIKVSSNETLKSRLVEERQKGSEEYMELMQNFQQAFDELQEVDNHPKRLGDPNQKNLTALKEKLFLVFHLFFGLFPAH